MTTLVFYSEFDSFSEWSALLAPHLPGVTICCAEEVQDANDVHFALAWKPPHGFFAPYRNLKLLVNLGAGVDSLVGRDDLPDIPIIRLSDPDMAAIFRHLNGRNASSAGTIFILGCHQAYGLA